MPHAAPPNVRRHQGGTAWPPQPREPGGTRLTPTPQRLRQAGIQLAGCPSPHAVTGAGRVPSAPGTLLLPRGSAMPLPWREQPPSFGLAPLVLVLRGHRGAPRPWPELPQRLGLAGDRPRAPQNPAQPLHPCGTCSPHSAPPATAQPLSIPCGTVAKHRVIWDGRSESLGAEPPPGPGQQRGRMDPILCPLAALPTPASSERMCIVPSCPQTPPFPPHHVPFPLPHAPCALPLHCHDPKAGDATPKQGM